MKFQKKAVSFQIAGTLLAGVALLAVPVMAQQEVAPDHFDEKPSVSQGRKPAHQSHKNAAKTKGVAPSHTRETKSKTAQAAPVLKADAATNHTDANPR